MARTLAELTAASTLLHGRMEAAEHDVAELWAAEEKLTDQVGNLQTEVAVLREKNTYDRRQIEELRDATRKAEQVSADLRQDIALARQLLAEHVKRAEQWESRRWQLAVLFLGSFVGSVLTLIANLTLVALRAK